MRVHRAAGCMHQHLMSPPAEWYMQIHWSSVVWFGETKASLLPTDAREEVLGQLSDRVQRMFEMQPQRRFACTSLASALRTCSCH